MQHRVSRKQPNSRMCLVCGLGNTAGIQASFYDLENGQTVGLFTARDEHQSYPGRLHGGLVTAMLDEAIGRAVMASVGYQLWGVTAEFTTRFKKPVPLGVELRVVGRVDKQEGRVYNGSGEILLPDGDVAASGLGRYVMLPLDRIAESTADDQDWGVVASPEDPHEIPLP
jgi:acyl-coenzyme A thioesterase PaaI-like protein